MERLWGRRSLVVVRKFRKARAVRVSVKVEVASREVLVKLGNDGPVFLRLCKRVELAVTAGGMRDPRSGVEMDRLR